MPPNKKQERMVLKFKRTYTRVPGLITKNMVLENKIMSDSENTTEIGKMARSMERV